MEPYVVELKNKKIPFLIGLYMIEQSSKVTVGSHVWVEDPDDAWIDGEVEEVNSEEITVNCSGKTVVAKLNNVYPKDPEFPELGVDDMTKLAYLHEPGVLLNLKCRYNANEIYTYTGNILIAVNPFKRLPHLYGSETMKQYKGTAFGELSPHPFAVADSAYRKMINEGVSQAILVSGESGAGKTESTKMLMQYLAYMGGRAESEGRSVEQQVLESNPVLEAFGNAKTVRNNNSSRFGKFVEIQFDQRGRISGAAIRTYLLERSRVCQVSDPERNYHCFYMLCAAPEQETERYKLGKPSTFRYLNQSNCYALDGLDDSKEYLATRKAMDVVGINSEEQDGIFRVVAAILHLGNIEFAKGEESEASEPKDEKSRFHLKVAAELFMCDGKALEDSLCKRVMVTRDESITKSLDPDSAALGRDALAKIVYSKLFDWLYNFLAYRLVTKINNSIGQDPNSKHIIGVLDIYGFESFKTNSFEQFCINLTNEKLQQHFNQHVFKMEQEEYTKEEIDWSYIEFIDNQDVLDLIEKKPGGIIALLDEACMFPRSTHDTFAQKLYQTFKNHKRFGKPKLAQTDFTICHYAGDVTYQTELFLDKNKDYVVGEHQALLSSSDCSFVSSLFPPLPEESSKTSKFSSIGSQFKQQLQSLLESLSTTEPHYIRCVKPNNLLKPDIFENINILHQLRCGGVMEAIRISCAGYPTRKPFNEFLTRFRILAPETTKSSYDEVDACKKLLAKVDLKGQMAEMDAHRAEVLGHSARIIQRNVLTYQSRKKFLLLQAASTEIQALCRGNTCYMRLLDSMFVYQAKQARTYICQNAYKTLCSSACSIQTGMRAKAARIELQLRKKRRATIIIQVSLSSHIDEISQIRRCLCHQRYVRTKKAAITTQCGWRVKVARRELRNLKMAAKETGALQDAKTKLENQVEELTSNLELEKQMRMEIEEAKSQEIEALQSVLTDIKLQLRDTQETKSKEISDLQSVLTDIKLQLRDTQETKSKEISDLQSALQDMQLEIEELSKGLEMTNDLAAENEQLKVSHKILCPNFLLLLSVSVLKTMFMILYSAIIKLETENQKLKALVSSMEEKIDELDRKHDETSPNITEKLKEDVSFDYEIVSNLEAENERLKVIFLQMYSTTKETQMDQTCSTKCSLEKKINESGNNSTDEQEEGKYILKEESLTEDASIDNERVKKLADENKDLNDLVSSLEKKIDETEKKYEEASRLCEERLKQALDAETGLIDLKTSMQRLEEKVSDMETAEQIRRQQALVNSASRRMSPQVSFTGAPEPLAPIPSRRFGTESFRRSRIERQPHEFVDVLLKCVSKNIGFSHGKPVAALTIYKCLMRWKIFEAEKTSIFDRIVPVFGSAIENQEDDNHLAYWLTNTSTLLFLLQRSLRQQSSTGSSPTKPPQPTSFFGRMTQVTRKWKQILVLQVDARYPALLFKQQLTAYVETMYGIIRENVKREVSSLLSSCIQSLKESSCDSSVVNSPSKSSEENLPAKSSEENSPKKSSEENSPKESSGDKSPQKLSDDNSPSKEGQAVKSSEENSPASSWQSIIEFLNYILITWKKNYVRIFLYVPLFLVQKMFSQTFQYINVQLFNSLLLEREYCTVNMGIKVKAGLDELESWCSQATEEFVGSSWDELKHTRQAVVLLVLSTEQLYRICTLCKDKDDGDHNVSPEVISNLKLLLTNEDENSRSFLLDDDSSIPFDTDEISSCMQEKDFANVKSASELADNPNFLFLKE
ncbi:Strong similarity to Arabidopsis myosin MYA1 (gb/Z28389) [Arabidopsis thaliana]|nr:Strong similarity to Arabidopsis myosin MYA1 (gb/Z28389) [Arabidopsis thaliana]